jgi:hypothetical protein
MQRRLESHLGCHRIHEICTNKQTNISITSMPVSSEPGQVPTAFRGLSKALVGHRNWSSPFNFLIPLIQNHLHTFPSVQLPFHTMYYPGYGAPTTTTTTTYDTSTRPFFSTRLKKSDTPKTFFFSCVPYLVTRRMLVLL